MKKHTTKKSILKLILKTLFCSFLLIILLFFLIDLFSPSNNNTNQIKIEPIQYVKDKIVYISYDYTGKNSDGSYFKNFISGSGVMSAVVDSKIQIITNRHVVDCGYIENCYQRLSENFKIRAQDNNIYEISRVAFAPHGLDLAIIEIDKDKMKNYNGIYIRNETIIGEDVVAIGYPALSGISNVLEFTTSKGKITNVREFLTKDGFSFEGIESDVYTNFGSSGGGLFDSSGNLIGINTWLQGTKISIAISLKSINELNKISLNTFNDKEKYIYCEQESYINNDNECLLYCKREEVLGKDGSCYGLCKDFYCKSQKFDVNDPRCDKGLIAGTDGYCHQPCESPSTYCAGNSMCYNNKCISCPDVTTRLFEDGTCRFYD